VWSTIATTELDLACSVAVGDVIYVGTDDARVLPHMFVSVVVSAWTCVLRPQI
jgi:hypothetical protein